MSESSAPSANIFGTDGIRDVAGRGWLAADSIARIGAALGRLAHSTSDAATPRILLGRDTRTSGLEIETALATALAAGDCSAHSCGVLPTPAVSLLVGDRDYDLGVVVSASHNPPEFNGIKVFDRRGAKLGVATELELSRLYRLATVTPRTPRPAVAHPELRDGYLAAVLASVGRTRARVGFDLLAGMRVVLDCARGATVPVAAAAFRGAGAIVTTINEELDGERINVDCGSLNPAELARRVVADGAALGIAFDGDGDRAIIVDERGAIVDGDEVMALWALELKRARRLDGDVLVATVMSNAGMEAHLAEQGVRLVRAQVGDREVYADMVAHGAVLGGEQSGHIIYRPEALTGDGIRTGLHVAALVRAAGGPLSALRAAIPRYPQTLIGVKVSRKIPLAELSEVTAEISAATAALAGHGRVLVRYSGTEPLLRILIEGRDPVENVAWAERLATRVRASSVFERGARLDGAAGAS
ncbi:MAG: phosphoglucosamine mutase [Planctomycetota bacterium]